MKKFNQIIQGQDGGSSINSKIFSVSKGKKYILATEYFGITGEPFSAYFGVIFLNDEGKEVDRKIRWLNDFSGKIIEEQIIFTAQSNEIFAVYRINTETPCKSSCAFKLKSLDEVTLLSEEKIKNPLTELKMKLKKSLGKFEESYDSIQDFVVPLKRGLTRDQQLTLEKNLVFLFGSPRSGTTWLGKQLLSFNTFTMDEPRIGRFMFPTQKELNDDRKDYFFSKEYQPAWRFFLRKLILNRIYSQFGNITKKIIIKDPNASLAAHIIANVLPNSKILVLLRDGRDVVDSLVDGRSEKGWNTKLDDAPPLTKRNQLNFIESQSRIWIQSIKHMMTAYNSKSEDLRYLVKYEDLRNQTLEELEKIYKFLNVEISEKQLKNLIEKFSFKKIPEKKKGHGQFTRGASSGNWKQNFDKREQTALENIMGKTLRRIGYE